MGVPAGTPGPEVARALGFAVLDARRVPGGDLNDAWRLELADGDRRWPVFVKCSPPDVPAGTSGIEAGGLRWLGSAGELRVPEVVAVGERFLVLEWIEPGRLDARGEEDLGRGLAAVHAAGAPAFGWVPPVAVSPDGRPKTVAAPGNLRIGPIAMHLQPVADWGACYVEQMLIPLLDLARARGALERGAAAAVDRVCGRVQQLAGPREPPARLHGDLWSGNVLADLDGRPWLIDPAAYGGHREMDLAMLRLFGGTSERVFAAYAEVAPLAVGHEERIGLWHLFPLLVHAVLFGGSYGAAVGRTAARYA